MHSTKSLAIDVVALGLSQLSNEGLRRVVDSPGFILDGSVYQPQGDDWYHATTGGG